MQSVTAESLALVRMELQDRCKGLAVWSHANVEALFIKVLLDFVRADLLTQERANELATTSQVVVVHGPDGSTSAYVQINRP